MKTSLQISCVRDDVTRLSVIAFTCLAVALGSACSPSVQEPPPAVSRQSVQQREPGLPKELPSHVTAASSSGEALSGGVAETPAEPRVEKIVLEPDVPVTGDRITAGAQVTDPLNRDVEVTYLWMVDGVKVQESTEKTLDFDVRFGAFVEVEAIPSAGGREGKSLRVFRTVANAPPMLRVENQQLLGSNYQGGIRVEDPEGDPVELKLQNGPPGMTLNRETGALQWPIEAGTAGVFDVSVLGRDAQGGEALLSFQVSIGWVQEQGGTP